VPKLPEGTSSVKKPAGEAWRKHGKLHRAKLLVQDEEVVASSFELSPTCNVEKYYEIASTVSFFKLQGGVIIWSHLLIV
jgi:hypothetical protein